MKRKLWICWEDRCLMWDEIDEDLIIDTMVDIYYKENPDSDLSLLAESFIDCMSPEKFEEIRQMAIEKIESRFEYFEI